MTATESAERSTVLGCSAMGCHRVWGEAAGRSLLLILHYYCSTVLSFHTLFLISIPWDQCRNFDHLSSVRTRLELTLALVFAAGQWVSLTETLRPFRWLLPSSVALSLSLSFSLTVSLSAAALTPFLFYPLSHLLFSSRPSFPPLFLFFSHPLLPPFLHSPSLPLSPSAKKGNRDGGQQIFCLSRSALLYVSACRAGHGTAESSAFLSQLVTRKPWVRSGR